jgi:hypothetical protein
MVDSKEFAEGIFDALARRRRQSLERITKEELYDFWLQISDQSFDARLQIFFDMYALLKLLLIFGSQSNGLIPMRKLPLMCVFFSYRTFLAPNSGWTPTWTGG